VDAKKDPPLSEEEMEKGKHNMEGDFKYADGKLRWGEIACDEGDE